MRKTVIGLLTGVVISSIILSGCMSVLSQDDPALEVHPQQGEVFVEPQAIRPQQQMEGIAAYEGALETIYNDVSPSVVNIQVRVPVSQSQNTIPLPFFGQQTAPETPQYQQALGSGFIWDTDGDIVTNNHVVSGAQDILVTFSDGTTADATLIAADPDSDLAVIKVDGVPAEVLVPVKVADSTELHVGQLAVAIGSPFGLEETMTVGIVSALGRALPASENPMGAYSIPDIIQTDAPINPGNSGGVLVNDRGALVGVTTAIQSPVGASAGIGFAVPSVIVNRVVPALIADGEYAHPYLGLSGTSLNRNIAEAMNLESNQRGALVMNVSAGGPADEAGIHGSDHTITIDNAEVEVGGDVITAIDDQPVIGIEDVITYLARYTEAGQQVTLTVLRDGKSEDIAVTLGERPTNEGAQDTSGVHLGIQGGTLTPPIAEAMGLDTDQQGVLVGSIEQGSPADEGGLQGSFKTTSIDGVSVQIGGDIITNVDGQAISSIEELQQALHQHNAGDEVVLTILRDGKQIKLDITLSE